MLSIKPDPPKEFLQQVSHLPPVVAKLLWQRGVRNAEEARKFLEPTLDDLYDPFLLRGIKEAVERIHAADERGEKVAVVSDFDTDGITAAAIMTKVFRHMKYDPPRVFLPDRFAGGKPGVSKDIIDVIAEEGRRLMIIVDSGSGSTEEIEYALAKGVDVIVIDHHRKTDDLSSGAVYINPELEGETYPFQFLCACGLVFKLSHALSGKVDREFLCLAAIATIGDKVVLTDENRVITKLGREALAKVRAPGLRVLREMCGIHLDAIAQRINSAHITGEVSNAYELLISDDEEAVREIAQELDEEFAGRERALRAVVERAAPTIQEQKEKPVIVIVDDECPSEIRGTVANRFLPSEKKPVLICGTNADGAIRCSSRCRGEVDMVQLFSRCSEHLDAFGGHPNAAGCAMKEGRVEELKECLWSCGDMIRPLDPDPATEFDAWVTSIDKNVMHYLDEIKPYGMGNPIPIMLFVPE